MPGTITNAGRNAVRDFVETEVSAMGVGTGTNTPTKANSSLQNPVTDGSGNPIRKSLSAADGATGEAVFTASLSASEANGHDLTEFGAFDQEGDLQARITHSEIRKTSDFEVEYRLTETVENT